MTPDNVTDFEMRFKSQDDQITSQELKHVLDYLPEILKEMNQQSETKQSE